VYDPPDSQFCASRLAVALLLTFCPRRLCNLLGCGGQFATLTTLARTFAQKGAIYKKQLICLSGYSYYPQRHIQTNFSVQKFERAVVVNDPKKSSTRSSFCAFAPLYSMLLAGLAVSRT